MNESLTWARLVLKELKQLRPLLLTLVGCSLGFHIVFILIDRELPHEAIPWTICCLYNAGVGAILVGQEKEKGTLTWLRTLPITPTKLLASKFFAGITGFELLSIAIFFIWWLAVAIDPPKSLSEPLLSEWIEYSAIGTLSFFFACLFLFSLGFALAWKIESPLLSLILILPISMVPVCVTVFIIDISIESFQIHFVDFAPTINCITLLLSALIASALAWRFGIVYLRPKRSSRYGENQAFTTQLLYRPIISSLSVPPPSSPALLWQYLKQNRWLLTSLVLAATLPFVAGAVFHIEDAAMGLGFVCVGLATTWLGVSTFASDAHKNRIRFLASLGVSPGKVWWTRQLTPVITVFLGTAFISTLIAGTSSAPELRSIASANFLDKILTIFLVFAVAQWIGQIIRSPIIAMVLAPIVSIGCLLAGIAAIELFGVPFWTRWIMLLIPFIATWIGMSSWMDGRTGLRYWLLQATLFLIPIALACLPIVKTWFEYPPIDRRTSNEIKRLAKEYPYSNYPTTRIVFPRRIDAVAEGEVDYSKVPDSVDDKPTEDKPIPSRREQIELVVSGFEQQLSKVTGPIEVAYGCNNFLQSWGAVERMRIESSSDSEREDTIGRYRRAIKLLMQMQMSLRKSARLLEQDIADRLEAWLLREAEREDAYRNLGRVLLNELGLVFRNADLRNQHRRWAVAVSREKNRIDSDRSRLGGMTTSIPVIQGKFNHMLAANHQADTVCKTLLDSLNASQARVRREELESLANLYGFKAAPTDNAPYIVLTSLSSAYPGYLWFGDWETRANQFPVYEDKE